PGLDKANDPEFAGGVVRLPEIAVDADDAGRIQDHAAPLGDHRVDHRARAVERSFQVDVDDAVELRVVHLLQARIERDAGIVHEHIDAAVFGPYFADHRVDLVAFGDIDRKSFDRSEITEPLDCGIDAVEAPVAPHSCRSSLPRQSTRATRLRDRRCRGAARTAQLSLLPPETAAPWPDRFPAPPP